MAEEIAVLIGGPLDGANYKCPDFPITVLVTTDTGRKAIYRTTQKEPLPYEYEEDNTIVSAKQYGFVGFLDSKSQG